MNNPIKHGSPITPKFYDDVQGLTIEAKLLGVFLLTGPDVNRIGLRRVNVGGISETLEIPPQKIKEGLAELCERFGWKYDAQTKVLFIRTFFYYNPVHTAFQLVGGLKDLSEIPDTPLIKDWAKAAKTFIKSRTNPTENNPDGTDLHEIFDDLVGPRLVKIDGVESVEPVEAPPKKTKVKASKLPDHFQDFWDVWPRKDAKMDAIQAWKKLNPDSVLIGRILADIEVRKVSKRWTKDDGEFIPYPATYLNKRRWEDEAPKANKSKDWDEEI